MELHLALQDNTQNDRPEDPKGRNRHFTVRVRYDPITDNFAAVLDGTTLQGDGSSLAESLHQLANQIDGWRLYGSNEDAIKARTPDRNCKYCDAPIFSAKNVNGRWVAFDTTTVEATRLFLGPQQGWACRVYALVDASGQLNVRSLHRPQGQVWIPHPEVCGTVESEPSADVLSERWRANRERLLTAKERRRQHFLRIANDIRKEQEAE